MKNKIIEPIIQKGLKMKLFDSSNDSNSIVLLDENNKEFSFSMSDVTRIVEDSNNTSVDSINDNDNPKVISIETQVVDSDGKELQISDIIKDIDNNTGEVSAIDVLIEATHSGRNSNHYIYNSQDLEDAVPTWKSPFNKPLLKNHSISSEPLGRVIDAYYSKSEIAEDRDTINTVFRVSDKDAMVKFLDKRYKTVSIGAGVSNVRCNICGKDILKDGVFKFCGHWRGEVYNGEKAYWTASLFDYIECSVVNNPADKFAQVKKIVVVKKDDINDNNNKNGLTDSNDNSLINDIDNVIDGNATENNNEENASNTNDASTEGDKDKNPDANNTLSIEDKYEKAIKDLDDKNNEVATLNNAIAEKEAEIKSLQDKAIVIKNESEKNKENFLSVSIMYKDSLVDHILTKKIINGVIDSTKIDTEKTSLLSKRTNELLDMNKELVIKDKASIDDTSNNASSETNPSSVTNPALVNNDNGNVIEDDNENNSNTSTKKDDKKLKTLKDLEEEYLKSL